MSNENNNLFGEVIFSYSRTQAIADGVLVDLTQFEVTRHSWKMHVACTDSVWGIIDLAVKHAGKDYQGILHDIYTMARMAVGKKSSSIITFRVLIASTMHELKMICGPGDDLRPVLTLMLPHED